MEVRQDPDDLSTFAMFSTSIKWRSGGRSSVKEAVNWEEDCERSALGWVGARRANPKRRCRPCVGQERVPATRAKMKKGLASSQPREATVSLLGFFSLLLSPFSRLHLDW